MDASEYAGDVGLRQLGKSKSDRSAQSRTWPTLSAKRAKRNLHLVKCDRCRWDKQKCTPVARVWPKKCDRCIKKGFSCSTGRRVERKSKFTAVDVPGSSGDEPAKSDEDQGLEEQIDTLVFLVGYHKIASMALDRLYDLKKAMLQPFIDSWDIEYQSMKDGLKTMGEEEFQSFVNGLGSTISKKKDDILAAVASVPASQMFKPLVSAFAGDSLTSLELMSACPFCSPKSEEIIADFKKRKLVCNEFLFRQRRLSIVLQSKGHLDRHRDNLSKEYSEIIGLCSVISAKAASKLGPNPKCFFFSGNKSVFSGVALFLRSSIDELTSVASEIDFLHWRHDPTIRDCLGRTTAHQWLDALEHEPNDDDWLDILRKYVCSDARGLDKQDILGRTLLHITCQRRWLQATRMLLELGADPGALTGFRSLPLHYAAANDSRRLCTLLLAHQGRFIIDQEDLAGLSASEYASNWCEDIIKLLAQHGSDHEEGISTTTLISDKTGPLKRSREGPALPATNASSVQENVDETWDPDNSRGSLAESLRSLNQAFKVMLFKQLSWPLGEPHEYVTIIELLEKLESLRKTVGLPASTILDVPPSVALKDSISAFLRLAIEMGHLACVPSGDELCHGGAALAVKVVMHDLELRTAGLTFLPKEYATVGKIIGNGASLLSWSSEDYLSKDGQTPNAGVSGDHARMMGVLDIPEESMRHIEALLEKHPPLTIKSTITPPGPEYLSNSLDIPEGLMQHNDALAAKHPPSVIQPVITKAVEFGGGYPWYPEFLVKTLGLPEESAQRIDALVTKHSPLTIKRVFSQVLELRRLSQVFSSS